MDRMFWNKSFFVDMSYSQKRKRTGVSGYGSYKRARRPFLRAPRTGAVLARTGGNYSQVARRWNSARGSYVVGPGPEKKFIDYTTAFVYNFGAGGIATGAASIVLLNGLMQGTDATTRIGRKIMMKSIQIRQDFEMAATSTAGMSRTIVVYDSQTNGAAPVITDILQSASITSSMNLNNRERFKVIWDKTQLTESIAAGPSVVQLKLYKKCNYPVIFNAGNAGTVADIQTGGVFALTYSTIGVASPTVSTYERIRFLDD